MRAKWLALGLVARSMASIDMTFHSEALDDDLVVAQMPNAKQIRDPSPLKVVDNVIKLTKGTGKSLSSIYVQAIRAAARAAQGTQSEARGIKRANAGVSPLDGIAGSIYTAPVSIGNTTYQLVVDTGSSDPWIASSTFQCIDTPTGTEETQAYCSFGPLYNPSNSSTFSSISNENFNVSYADGENLNGVMGYETISMAGISVTQQEFGVVTRAAWYGDGTSSGLVGFAYSTLTSAYNGTNASADVSGGQLTYPPLFTSMYTKGLTSPLFSIALSRNSTNAGLMAIGGIPNIQHSPAFASVPIQPVGINATSQQLVYQYYSIVIDGWAISASQSAQFNVAGTNNSKKTSLIGNGTQVIVDSGTSLLYAPDTVAAAVAAAFNPAATYDSDLEAYTVNCSATVPLFGVAIAKKIFYVNALDMLITGAGDGLCYLGVQPNDGGLTILGDVWMKNVLAVFDIGAEQMRFAAREFYSTPACSGNNCVGTS